jgi:hypothetical protein
MNDTIVALFAVRGTYLKGFLAVKRGRGWAKERQKVQTDVTGIRATKRTDDCCNAVADC